MMSVRIDETAYVEAEEGRKSLEFPDEKQQARFELGASMLIYAWDDLDVAVANEWGGPESAEKRDWITGIVVGLFKENKIVDIALIEETLLYAMFDEFETNIEDDTALVVAANVVKLYEECAAENYTRVERMYNDWLEKQKQNQGKPVSRPVHIEGSESSEDESEDGDEDGEANPEEDVDMEVDEHTEQVSGPIVDEDGFELVQKGRRRRAMH